MMQNMDLELNIRRLQHRLKCLGMAELDAWVAGLESALQTRDSDIVAAVDDLLQQESPELLLMMAQKKSVPDVLKPWLS